MVTLRPNEPTERERKCGNCSHYKLKGLDKGSWTGPWVCKSQLANPEKKDPKDGQLNSYKRPACEYWD